eukprot:SAG25_NODE_109_length_15249_cov_11.793201_4_plen_40_part_00
MGHGGDFAPLLGTGCVPEYVGAHRDRNNIVLYTLPKLVA